MKKKSVPFLLLVFTIIGINKIISVTSRELIKAYQGREIKKIEVKGLKNTSERDFFSSLTIREGDPFSPIAVKNAIKSLWSTGYYEDIEVEAKPVGKDIVLIFTIKEKPIVDEIIFRGAEEYYSEDLKETIPLKEGDVYSLKKVLESERAIFKKYNDDGFFLVTITHKIVKNEKENTVKVIFIIDENIKPTVQRIVIEGAKHIKPSDIYSELSLDEEGFFTDGNFNEEKFEESKQKIINLYKRHGFLDVKLLEASVKKVWLSPKDIGDIASNTRGLIVKFVIQEGDKYYFGGYEITGNYKVYKKEDFFKLFQLRRIGEVFNYDKFMMDRQSISILYAQKGYIFARINVKKQIKKCDEGKKCVKIIFVIANEGKPAYIKHIYIKGNVKTKDRVIRRELLIKPGDRYNFFKVQRSRERIFNLGFFKNVDIKIRPLSEEAVNLVVEVEEQPTGTISLGGGYGTLTGFSIFTELAENNLMGNGQRVSTRIEYGPNRKYLEVGFREPWLFETTPVSLSLSLYLTERKLITSPLFPEAINVENPVYYELLRGFSITLGYRFWVNWGVWNTISPRWSTTYGASGASPDSVFALIDRGTQFRLKDTIGIYYDTRDNIFNPTRGLLWKFYIDLVGGVLFMIGDDHYIRYNAGIYYYFTIFRLSRNYPGVIELRLSGNFTDDELKFLPQLREKQDPEENPYLEDYDKLRLGGVETLRGWDYSDIDLPAEWRIGEKHRILWGIEFRIPVVSPVLWFVLFWDAGALWNDITKISLLNQDYRFSYGFGLKVQIPVMPIRFYFGRKVQFEDGRLVAFGGFNFAFGIGDMRF